MLQGKAEAKRVLLIGRPGCGKSMLLNKITLDWTDSILLQAKNKNKSEEINFTSKFDLLIYIDLSKWGPTDTITHYLKFETNTEELLNYLKEESSKCLFILDSWDEFSQNEKEGQIKKLAKGHLFQESAMIIASKFMEKKLLPDYLDKTCIIQGFSEKQARTFVQKLFNNDNVLATLGSDIFSDPFMLHAACFLFKNDIPVTVYLTRFFVEIVLIMINKANNRRNVPNISSLADCKAHLLSIGKLALLGLTESRNVKKVFTEDEANRVEPGVVEKGCDLDLLHRITNESRYNPVQVTFPHRILQKFLAAIYVANAREGFEILDNYISDLVIANDLQMLITFVCGLSNERGHQCISKVIEESQKNPPLGDVCPDFCWAGWVSLDYVWTQLHARKAENISPFILNCLWEMSRNEENVFPFNRSEVCQKPTLLLQPDFNFKTISLSKVNNVVQMENVKFDKGNVVRLYNLNDDKSIGKDCIVKFDFLQEVLPDVFDVQSFKDEYRYNSLITWLEKQRQLVKFYMSDVTMQRSEMQSVVKTIRVHLHANLRTLFLREVDLNGVEQDLCETLLQLHSLYFFCLRETKISEECASNICKVFSDNTKFPELERLDFFSTDLSGANDKLGKAIACQSQLKELKLDDTKMTETQTQEVCRVLARNTSLISLGLSENNMLGKDIHPLASNVGKLVNLKDLNVSNCLLAEQQMISLVENLPQSIQALRMWETDEIVKEHEPDLKDQMQKLRNLKLVQMNMRTEGAILVQKNSNIQVCTLSAVSGGGSEWNSEKLKIAKCLKQITEEYDKFTSEELHMKNLACL